MSNIIHRTLFMTVCLSGLNAQNPAMNTNIAAQMQQQQFQAQRMFQMQQQMQRMMQQQQMMQQQRQLQQQMSAQAQAQRAQKEAQVELTSRRLVALPPPLMAKPSKETWAISTDLASNFPAFDGSSRLAAVATGPRRIQGLSLSEGKTLWESPLDGKPALDPLFANENLIYATADYQLVALNGDSGKENHRLKLDALNGYVLSGRGNHPKVLFPAMDGSRMVLATYGKGERSPTGWIYSIDLASWTIQWKFEFLGGPDLTPQIKGDKVLIGGGGRVLALNLADGKQVWECRVGSDEELKDGPLLGDRLAVVCGRNLLAIDTTRGTQLWSVPYQTFYQPQGDGERILYTEERGWIIHEQWVVALDIKTGKKVWDRELSGTRLPWIQDGVVLCNAKGTLMSLDLATGKQLWAHELKGAPALPLTVFGDALYVVNWEGDSSLMQALRLKDGSVAWDYTYPHKPSNGMVLLTPSGFVISGNDPTLLLLN